MYNKQFPIASASSEVHDINHFYKNISLMLSFQGCSGNNLWTEINCSKKLKRVFSIFFLSLYKKRYPQSIFPNFSFRYLFCPVFQKEANCEKHRLLSTVAQTASEVPRCTESHSCNFLLQLSSALPLLSPVLLRRLMSSPVRDWVWLAVHAEFL